MRVVILSILLVGVAVANVAFEEWTKQHNKVYTSWNEKEYRKGIWEKNLNKVLTHNIRFLKGETTYSMAMNHYGDLTPEEFRAHKKCLRYGNESNLTMPKVHYKGSTFLKSQLNASIPDSIDYRKLGFVTKIKDQGQCGSCWAFSTTGALEGQLFRKTGKLPVLSEQQLVDCAGKFGNYGCDGGLMEAAFTYIMSVKGLESEKSYPYTAEDGECTFDPSMAAGKDSGYLAVPAGNETMLTQALAELGPVSIAIDASQSSFQFYDSGVYDEPDCSSTELDHGVLAVGYGTLKGKPYYIVKNSWGTGWGMKGYIMMTRNGKNQCGVASDANIPLV